jgi:hypothetical protein
LRQVQPKNPRRRQRLYLEKRCLLMVLLEHLTSWIPNSNSPVMKRVPRNPVSAHWRQSRQLGVHTHLRQW